MEKVLGVKQGELWLAPVFQSVERLQHSYSEIKRLAAVDENLIIYPETVSNPYAESARIILCRSRKYGRKKHRNGQ